MLYLLLMLNLPLIINIQKKLNERSHIESYATEITRYKNIAEFPLKESVKMKLFITQSYRK